MKILKFVPENHEKSAIKKTFHRKTYFTYRELVYNILSKIVVDTAQKTKFSIKDFLSKCEEIILTIIITFTEEILDEKLHILCSVTIFLGRLFEIS